jgi:putative NADPH-quinone reductase/putative sterol carrier protein
MKILLLHSNPRKQGYTHHITGLVVKGAREAGATVTDVDLTDARIHPCVGCYRCWLTTPGVCRFKDDMTGIIKLWRDTDMVLFSSPLYSYSVSTHLKQFLDRTLCMTKEGFVETATGGVRNTIRTPETWPKKMAYILVGAFRGEENFDGARRTLQLFSSGIDIPLAGELIRPESYLLQFTLAKPKTIKIVETAFEKAGLELAVKGKISADTSDKARSPLSPDVAHFKKYSNIYWEHAKEMGEAALDLAAVQQRVTSDMRVLMSEMVRSIDPVATQRLRAVLQFDFPDKDLHFRVVVDRGKCSMEQAKSDKCDLRVTVDAVVWARVFMREINIRDALAGRKILLEGDKMLFTRLDRYFPPPVN